MSLLPDKCARCRFAQKTERDIKLGIDSDVIEVDGETTLRAYFARALAEAGIEACPGLEAGRMTRDENGWMQYCPVDEQYGDGMIDGVEEGQGFRTYRDPRGVHIDVNNLIHSAMDGESRRYFSS